MAQLLWQDGDDEDQADEPAASESDNEQEDDE
jgi:hypothetical protein